VARRFNDFKQLHEQLCTCEEYKGFAIPPLPSENDGITSFFVHDQSFLSGRAKGLEQYLRVVTAHGQLKLDLNLQQFLTS
jgi:hypothetical protein